VTDLLERPEWLEPAGLAWGAVALAVALAAWRGERRLRGWLGRGAAAVPRGRHRDALPLAALALVALALAGPRWATRVVEVPTRGVDVVLLLDRSRSMEARDVGPSRAARARSAAAELLRRLAPGHRVGLAGYAGRGVLWSPLTPDRAALREWLAPLGDERIEPGGSSLASGLLAAASAFAPEDERPRVIVVLGDGEPAGGGARAGRARPPSLEEAAAALRRARIRVVALGFGREAGSVIPVGRVPLRDRDGRVVESHRHMGPLRRLAEATGGAAFATDARGGVDVAAVTTAIDGWRAEGPGDTVREQRPAPATAALAAVALALLLADGAAPALRGARAARGRRRAGDPRPRRGARPAGGRAGRAVLVVAALSLGATAGAGDPAAARSAFLAGLQAGQAGRWPEARRTFRAAVTEARTESLAARALHNLGVAHLEVRDLAAARAAFLDSLALRPGAPETRFNLEWTLEALDREEPPTQPETGAGDDDAEPGAPDPTPERDEPAAETAPAAPGFARLDTGARRRWLAEVVDEPLSARPARPGAPAGAGRERPPTW